MEKIQLSDGSDLENRLKELERRIEAVERVSGSVRQFSDPELNGQVESAVRKTHTVHQR